MGEHTIREVLKRRSSETQRELQKRRDQMFRGKRSRIPLAIAAVIVLAIAAAAVYGGILASKISHRLAAEISLQNAHPTENINLQSATAFLPNTLLAVLDPGFYNASATTVSPVTRRLVRLYFPGASGLDVHIMAAVAQIKFDRTAILQAYLNDVPMGDDNGAPIVGYANASKVYFHQPFAQLQPQQIALLVAIMMNPGKNDPRRFPDKALASRNQVIQADVTQTVLSQDQGNALSKMPLSPSP